MYVYCTRDLYLRTVGQSYFVTIIVCMNNKAFIFDLDGVLINDEVIWEVKKQRMYQEVFGADVAEKLGSTLGINMDGIYERAGAIGTSVSKGAFIQAFYDLAADIYHTAPISEGLDDLVDTLKKLGYHMGIVSASPLPWITDVTKRLSFEHDIELIISLHE